MQVIEDIRKCVAYVYCKLESADPNRENMQALGTAFFVAYDILGGDSRATYAVTARHVIEAATVRAVDANIHFRMNNRQHGAQFVEIPIDQWVRHSDSKIDVAVAPFVFSFVDFDHLHLTHHNFLTLDIIKAKEIGPGDDLFFPGLFVRHPGKKSNTPIIRTGTIAAMPSEPIKTKMGETKMYLVEAKSIGGFSGSPVFVHLVGTRMINGEMVWVAKGGQENYFLGMVHGHYDWTDMLDPDSDGSSELATLPSADFITASQMNMGIACVVPAEHISEVLELPALVKHRETLGVEVQAKRKEFMPDMDELADLVEDE